MFSIFRSRRRAIRDKTRLLEGTVTWKQIRNGIVIREETYRNVICNSGIAKASGLINGAASGVFGYMAIGTGTGVAAATDTVLASEITTGGGARVSATVSQVTTTTTNDTAQWVGSWTFTASFAVTEEGLFDAASAGNLLAHQENLPAWNVVPGDQLQITHKVQL